MSRSAISLSQADRAAFLAAFNQLDRPERKTFPTPGALAAGIDPTTVTTSALEMLDVALLDVAEGRCDRLIWSMPPQEGKASGSAAVSHCGC